MAAHFTITLHPYKVWLKPKSGEVSPPLDRFGNSNKNNLLSFIQKRMKTRQQPEKFPTIKKTLNFKPWVNDQQNKVQYCGIDVGLFGTPESDFYDLNTNAHQFKKSLNSNEVITLYFSYKHNPGSNFAYVIMEKRGSHSCKDILHQEIQNELDQSLNSAFFLNMEPCPLEEVMLEMVKANNATEIRLTKNTIPEEYAKQLSILSPSSKSKMKDKSIPGRCTIILHPSRGFSFGKIGDKIELAMRKKGKLLDAVRIDNFDNDELSIICKVNGKSRTFRIGEKMTARPSLDITDEVERFKGTGVPKIESIHSHAIDLFAELESKKSAIYT